MRLKAVKIICEDCKAKQSHRILAKIQERSLSYYKSIRLGLLCIRMYCKRPVVAVTLGPVFMLERDVVHDYLN